ncbi:MAG: tRNA (uridine(34)/cytosine(34)/5-carboxymethylaminomethyluridine(34)-2'-O)-methyltransferase TrmL [Firmicutes bacterium]|nr:tRNA (uridine(34)/cytosine(34)/5-carboxymethylaminomethyluridine(34)-2'-O)-methyltransferase TrmL [Bacillota bacterium]
MHIVLVHPEIPPNTGNVARTCAATGTPLHLIRPLGFSLDERHLRRAGVDYWSMVEVYEHLTLQELWEAYPTGRFWYTSKKGRIAYSEVAYAPDDFLVFGPESVGLPDELIAAHPQQTLRLPMRPQARSLNLSNAVAILLYEALRQLDFPGLDRQWDPERDA